MESGVYVSILFETLIVRIVNDVGREEYEPSMIFRDYLDPLHTEVWESLGKEKLFPKSK